MNDEIKDFATDADDELELEKARLDELKHRADLLGISYHPNIGEKKLLERINAKLDEKTPETGVTADEIVTTNKVTKPHVDPEKQKLIQAKQKALQLVRCRITCMDPAKKEYEGEIFCAGNALIGTVKKYVPYETVWHVPRIILNMIKARQYQTFYTEKLPNGLKAKRGKLVRAYAVEELPPLTPKELQELRQRQAMASGTADV